MKILVVGSGGREHALAWKLARESSVTEVLAAPGNPGISQVARLLPIDSGDVDALAAAAAEERVDLTVVGPELPLDRGIVDLFSSRGLRILALRARLLSSSAARFSRRTSWPAMAFPRPDTGRAGPRPRPAPSSASAELGIPVVVKADGLAAGKGVVVATDKVSAEAAIAAAMEERQFGEAGAQVVLEECLEGPEVSFFAICDGRRAMPLASAQDHKRVFDDDKGPNTGGMGAFAPSPLLDAALEARIMRRDRRSRDPRHARRGPRVSRLPLRRVDADVPGTKVIEFNVRFGDPEAQVVVPMIDGDLAPVLAAAADGALGNARVPMRPLKHVGVVLAAGDYPRAGSKGLAIAGLDRRQPDDVLVFHAGTATDASGQIVTSGGRVLTVVGRGTTYDAAIGRAYGGIAHIAFDGMHYRRDIGRKALSRT